MKTIDKGAAYTIPYKGLEAVVSEVDFKKFSSEEIQKKAQEDLNWIKEKAQIHEHVIEQAMGPPVGEAGLAGKTIPVIPMKFGTIFKTKGNLNQMIGKYYPKFKVSLGDLAGKQEWGVKIYLNEKIFEKQLEQKNEEIAFLPKGMEFFAKKQMEKAMKKEKNRKLQGVLKEIFENLQKLAVKASQGKNLDKALIGREEPMVLNLNLLIKEEKVAEFQKEVNGLKTRYQNQGLIIQESGPWPPYNFVKL